MPPVMVDELEAELHPLVSVDWLLSSVFSAVLEVVRGPMLPYVPLAVERFKTEDASWRRSVWRKNKALARHKQLHPRNIPE